MVYTTKCNEKDGWKKTSDEMAVEMYSMNSTICKYCNNMYTITFKCDYI